MRVFISHSFENKPEFNNIAGALQRAKVPFWNPTEVQPGSSLRDQLRRAVQDCCLCVFVATARALRSSWCGTELGAFWGSGKPIIVWVAESSLSENDLPPIVQGDVWERDIWRVADRAAELVALSTSTSSSQTEIPLQVNSMTAEQLERIIAGAISLAMAASKDGSDITVAAKGAAVSVAEGVQEVGQIIDAGHADVRKHILWVDDRPDNNIYERQAFQSLGVEFTLALNTKEALEWLRTKRFAAIISDMGREEGPREGYVLLDAVRSNGDKTPFFIYAGSNLPQHKREAAKHGAQGSTNNAQELFGMVRQILR